MKPTPIQTSQWKKQFQENPETLFTTSDKKTKEASARTTLDDKPYAKIGKLEIELEFLKKPSS